MKIDVFAESGASTKSLSQSFEEWLGQSGSPPDFVALHQSVSTVGLGMAKAASSVRSLHGATSCLGVMSRDGPQIEQGAGAFAIWDPSGSYGTGIRALGDDPRSAARAATEAALERADRQGEAPDLVWLSSAPGSEELVIAGVEDVVGGNVPILGGSAADDIVAGKWIVFDHMTSEGSGVVVSVLFPSKSISFAYHNGYAPTSHAGTVTKASGRVLNEIDGRSAADVYRDWTGHRLIPEIVTGTSPILAESTLAPLGLYLESVGGVPYFLLAHPAEVTPDGALHLFADVAEGDRLTLMSGSPEHLTQRAGKVAALAAQSGQLTPDMIAGALVVYCGGCMLAVKDHLQDVTEGINEVLPAVPYLGIFTFGEQGVVMDGRNRHGNLMISAVVFGK